MPRNPMDSWEEKQVQAIVEHLRTRGCAGIDEKVNELSQPGKFGDLLAELRLGEQISRHLKMPVVFQIGADSDIRFKASGVECTIEVEHKSSIDPFDSVFYPAPDKLLWYRTSGQELWQKAAVRLNEIVNRLPIVIQPVTNGEVNEPLWGGPERSKQEERCGVLADWLADQLEIGIQRCPTILTHDLARFEITSLDSPPGRIEPVASVVWIQDFPDGRENCVKSMSEWFADAIKRKVKTALKYPERCAPNHLIALVVDEASAWSGGVLASTLLGKLCWAGREYRAVPTLARRLYSQSLGRGRGTLLNCAQFEPNETTTSPEGLFFDESICTGTDGVVALYYTDELQVLLNPFTSRNIEPLRSLFPVNLFPFRAGAA
jgi:hypothetical protein